MTTWLLPTLLPLESLSTLTMHISASFNHQNNNCILLLLHSFQERMSVYTTEDTWSNASQTSLASGLSECVLNAS